MNQIDLAGRRAVVTGGAQGIGRAVAERLLASGARVSLWDREATYLAATARELQPADRVHTAVVDLVSAADVEAATAATIGAFGGIDILVANAGISGRNDTLWQYPIEEWKQVIDVNLNGVFHCCRAI